jgi:hypothetical protein
MWWQMHVARIGEQINTYRVLMVKAEGRRQRGSPELDGKYYTCLMIFK